jgi:hypothetical protein
MNGSFDGYIGWFTRDLQINPNTIPLIARNVDISIQEK